MRINCEQGSADWFAARCGRVTASRMADVMNYLKKGGESQARKDYKTEIVVETLTRFPVEHYVSPAMTWGIEQQKFAIAAYEMKYDVSVDSVGFFVHPKINRFGASPDALIRQDGMAEFKCPTSTTHIEYIMGFTEAPQEYQWQMLAQMDCAEREWCDFVSFDPRMPPHLQMFVVRMYRDEERIKAMEAEVLKFLSEVDDIISRLPKDEAQAAVDKQVSEDMLLITKEDAGLFPAP